MIRPTYVTPTTKRYTARTVAHQMSISFKNILRFRRGKWEELARASHENAIERWVLCTRIETYVLAALNCCSAYIMRDPDREEREAELTALDNETSYREIIGYAAKLLSVESEDNE